MLNGGANFHPVDVAFYGTTKAVILDEFYNNLYVVDLPAAPAPGSERIYTCDAADTACKKVELFDSGVALAVDTARNRAVVSLDPDFTGTHNHSRGGAQTVDLLTNTSNTCPGTTPPSPCPIGPKGETLGAAIAPSGSPAIVVYENQIGGFSNGFAAVINLPVSSPPASPGVVDLATPPNDLVEPSAVAFNPVTLDALIAGDDSIAIVKPPYTAVSSQIFYPTTTPGLAGGVPLLCGTTKHGIAANPDGVRALVVGEDAACKPRAAAAPAPPPVAAVIAPARSSPKVKGVVAARVAPRHSGGHREGCELKRNHHEDGDRDGRRDRKHDD